MKKRFHYGSDPAQFADLYLPEKKGKLPVMVVIHGGYWKDNKGLDSYATCEIGKAFSPEVAVWNIEYRRMPAEGENFTAPWPLLLKDAAAAIDLLRQVAEEYPLNIFSWHFLHQPPVFAKGL